MRFIIIILALLIPISAAAEHEVYFKGSNYELDVYTIKGRTEGNTMLILGGIQGDEPGGFLSADLYAELKLEKGNLIVIPRANLKSVILFNRGTDGDMNRLFTDNISESDMEKVVGVIIEQMKKSDIFLNLHDGWGFHKTNPKRFGQSIIVDEDTFTCSDNSTIELGDMAKDVLAKVNARIDDEDHHLAFFNTHTGDPKSPHPSMRQTATWYALQNFCIPSFGIEASKNIKSDELKVLYHNYVVNEFMKILDIVPENPPIFVAPAIFDSALITINGESQTVRNGDVIKVERGAIVSVKHIESNYTRGVSSDILGFGNLNDTDREIPVTFDTKVVFRKDSEKFAEVAIEIEGKPTAVKRPGGYHFIISIDDQLLRIADKDTLKLKEGTVLRLHRLELNGKPTGMPINLRGWVSKNASTNDGDDRERNITINKGDMLERFAENGVYPITAENVNEIEAARIYLEIVE
ncbi:MAG: hypothetical protein LBV09_07365 [Deferribacteraceae bacterium]|jgi:hypothetical protein|nr:hypothetical protein [Deferribacteraceae bacterium]